uniref:hypothetical protein n=1 Tax=Candidatus Limisoma sp. TaxID=3076476 RepID=UPI003FF10486
MEITLVGKLLIAVLIAAIIGIIAGLIVRRGNDAKVGFGCGLMFPIALAVFITLQVILPDVVVVSNVNGQLSHDTKTLISSIEMPSGQSSQLSLCNKYIANFSDETLILYPEYYGPANKAKSDDSIIDDPIIIESNTVVCIKETPDYYFSPAAAQISSKSNSVEVRWVLETLRSVAEREEFDYEE